MRTSFIVLLACLISCTGKKDGKLNSTKEQVKFEQYLVEGQTLYITHCSNCHQAEGQGLARLFPPLAKSDYLMSDVGRAACNIRNGLKGEILVNGVTYNQPMPAIPDLTNLEIAEILTYISNSWGNNHGLVTIDSVEVALSKCD